MANGVVIPNSDIKTKNVTLGSGSNSFTTTAVNWGAISSIAGVTGLKQNHIIAVTVMQAALTPASNLIFGFYNDNLYIAATQNCTMSGAMTLNITYHEP